MPEQNTKTKTSFNPHPPHRGRMYYTTLDEAEAYLDDSHLLSQIRFSTAPSPAPRCFHVGLAQLQAPEYVEIWQSPQPVITGQHGPLQYAYDDEMLAIQVRLSIPNPNELEPLTEQNYRILLQFVQEMGYPAILRMWNFFPDINGESGHLENYKAFCLGRHRAFAANKTATTETLPAASAIGTHRGELLIYLLSAKTPGVQIENPRQISAFHYPTQYGPKSPSFSRAMLKRWKEETHLYISGTASIVGHETLHEGKVLAQLHETLNNIEVLLDTAKRAHHLQDTELSQLDLLRVYIRDHRNFPLIHSALQKSPAANVPTVYLHGDICRASLELEIEGLLTQPSRE